LFCLQYEKYDDKYSKYEDKYNKEYKPEYKVSRHTGPKAVGPSVCMTHSVGL
jgi:hypothetical protein